MLNYAANVLVMSRSHSSTEQLHKDLNTRFGDQVLAIGQLCFYLRWVAGEEMVAGDFERGDFDVESMEGTVSTKRTTNTTVLRDAVMCTIEMGLNRNERKGSEMRSAVLLKPKVLIEAALEELRRPGNSESSRDRRRGDEGRDCKGNHVAS